MTRPHHELAERSTAADPLQNVVFPGDSEMAALCRAYAWETTPLGPVDGWSTSLRTTVGIVLTSRQPMFLWWGPELVQVYNDAYCPSLGQAGRHSAALGARGRAFWTDIWDAIGPQIEQVMTTGESTWHEDQYLPIERNGRLEDVWWTYSYSPVRDDDGSIAATLVVCQETTERVRLQARLELERARLASLFQQSPSFVAVLRGPDHVFEMVNDAYMQIVGHGRDVLGKPIFDALPETRGQGFDEYMERVRNTGESLVFRELPVLLDRSPGAPREERYVDITYLPLNETDGAGVVTRDAVIAHGTDVTDQVRARRAVEGLLTESEQARTAAVAAERAADAANRAKGDFLSTMSHELRTPLNAIAGYAELLALGVRGPITDSQRLDLERLQRANRHMIGLVDSVLTFARVEAGHVEYQLESVPLAPLIADLEALVGLQLSAKRLAFDHDGCIGGATGRSSSVHADPEKLRQILLNLLTNAIKFTDPGGRVSLECEHDASIGVVRVRVRDTGRGIPADALTRIFEPFVQLERGHMPVGSNGVGLGLAISRDFARGMSGELAVESALGVGSTFTLVLPAAERET